MRRIADLRPGEAKTDARAVFIIAEGTRTMPRTLRSIQVADEQLAELTLHCGFDEDLDKRATATSNRIRGLGPRLDHPAVLDLLRTWPTPEGLRHAGRRRLGNTLKKLARRIGERLAGEIIAALDQQTVTVIGTKAATIVLPRLARKLADIRESQDTVFIHVEALVEAYPLLHVLTSLPASASGPPHGSSPRSSAKSSLKKSAVPLPLRRAEGPAVEGLLRPETSRTPQTRPSTPWPTAAAPCSETAPFYKLRTPSAT